jgi:hypothetical protein
MEDGRESMVGPSPIWEVLTVKEKVAFLKEGESVPGVTGVLTTPCSSASAIPFNHE